MMKGEFMSTHLTNNFNDIIDVAKTLSRLLASSVSIHPQINVSQGDIKIERCHLCSLPTAPIDDVESKLAALNFIFTGEREENGVLWEEWGRDGFFISLGFRQVSSYKG